MLRPPSPDRVFISFFWIPSLWNNKKDSSTLPLLKRSSTLSESMRCEHLKPSHRQRKQRKQPVKVRGDRRLKFGCFFEKSPNGLWYPPIFGNFIAFFPRKFVNMRKFAIKNFGISDDPPSPLLDIFSKMFNQNIPF